MTSPVDSASCVQDSEIMQKTTEQEQGDWRAEWKAKSCRPTSNLLSEVSDSASVQSAEVEQLKEKIANLECAQAAIEEEQNKWQARYHKEHEKSLRLLDTNAEQDRMISSLKDKLSNLRDKLTSRDKKLSGLEAQVNTFSEVQLRQKKKHEEVVTQLRSQLDEKDRDNASIQADLWMLTNDVRNAQPKNDFIDEDLTATGAQPFSFECSELEDVKKALATAEAELEAFYAILAHNEQLQIQYNAVLTQNIELMQTKNELLVKIKHTKQCLAIYRTGYEQAMNRVGELAEELELLKSDSSSDTDEQSREPETFFISLSTPEYSPDSPKPCQMPKLTYSVVQVLSTEPRPPKNLLADPEFRRRLHDFSTCITTLSTPRLPTFKPRPNTQPQPSSPPLHAHITLTIAPSTTSWTLLQRAQSAIFRSPSSNLAIKGPPTLVSRFVVEMQRLETHHAEQTRLALLWEKVAVAHMEEAKELRVELDKKGCGVPEHWGLVDELEAKEGRCEMLVALLGELQGRSG